MSKKISYRNGRGSKWLYPVALMAAASPLLQVSAAFAGQLGTIISLGDSITVGHDGGYQLRVETRLKAAGYSFNGNIINDGHSGWRMIKCDSDGLYQILDADLPNYQPDTVLLMIGTNDVGGGNIPSQNLSNIGHPEVNCSVDHAPKRLGLLIDKIRQKRPNAMIFVSNIIPLQKYDWSQQLSATYAPTVAAQVSQRNAAGDKLIAAVDVFTGFPRSTGYQSDLVHPTNDGQNFIGDRFADAIIQWMKSGGQPPAPKPTSTASVPASTFSVTSPSSGGTISSGTQIKGLAGSQWVNIAAYDANGNKVATDVSPSNGGYSLSLNTSKLANGPAQLAVLAFSVAAGQAGGTSSRVDLNVTVANYAPAPSPTPKPSPLPPLAADALVVTSPSGGATFNGTQVLIKGRAGSQWKNIAAYDGKNTGTKISGDATPINGDYTLTVDSTRLANGSGQVAIYAFTVAAGQAGGTSGRIDLNVAVQNAGAAPTPTPTATSGGGIGLNPNAFAVGVVTEGVEDLSRAAAMGIKTVRWDHYIATPANIEKARSMGIEVLPIASYGFSDISEGGDDMKQPRPGYQAEWAKRMVDTWRGMKNPPKVIEVWNEPWNGGFWSGGADAAEYLELVKAFAAEAWKQWPTVTLLVSADSQGMQYRQKLLAADKTGFLNDPRILPTVHPYVLANSPSNDPGNCDWGFMRYECVYNDFKAHGHKNPLVWVTEYGWETNNPSPSYAANATVTEQQQSDFTVQGLELMRKSGHVAGTYYFLLHVNANWSYNWLRPDNSNKPVVGAVTNYIKSLPK